MKKMSTQALREKTNSLYERMIQSGGLMYDLARVQGDIGRSKDTRNAAWERQLMKEIDEIRAKQAERERICKEYHELKAELDRHTDPKCKGYHGPVFEAEEGSDG